MIHQLHFHNHISSNGNLISIQDLPFEIKNLFILENCTSIRGNHARREMSEILVAIQGSFRLQLDTGKLKYFYYPNSPNQGILVPPNTWRILDKFTNNCKILAICSHEHKDEDYILNYEDFLDSIK